MNYNLKKNICVFTIHRAKDVRVLNRHCRSLQRLGMNVTLIAVSENGSYDDEGIKVIGITRWKGGMQRLKTLIKITVLAYKQKADIYHFHDPDLLFFAPFLRLFTFKPVVYDIHEFYSRQLPMKCPDVFLLRKFAGIIIWVIESFLGMLCGSISAVYMDHVRRFSRLGCKTVWTPNFASLDDFSAEPVTDEVWEKRRFTVIHTGTLSPSRGSLILLDIARELKKRRPEINVIITRRFWSERQENVMMEKLSEPGFQNVIEFVPHMSGRELPKFVRHGGVGLSLLQPDGEYLLPSHVPTKFFEYMSQSVPIVASNMPSSYEIVDNEKVGFVVDAGDVMAYVDSIFKIVDNPQMAKEMGENGRQAFIEKYNWGICEKNLGEFYSGLLKK
ncbi:glycosyltransferase [candidate division KSB1 bacterium]|nr:glycosyltransferase [candidate division KSB1 bacterium]